MKYLIAIWLAAASTMAYASCTMHTYYVNGKYVTCQTCCYGNNCNTTCF